MDINITFFWAKASVLISAKCAFFGGLKSRSFKLKNLVFVDLKILFFIPKNHVFCGLKNSRIFGG